MRDQTYNFKDGPVTVHNVESADDVAVFRRWLADHERAPLAFDTETSGLNVFGQGVQLRLAQIGDGQDAWVFDMSRDFNYHAVRHALLTGHAAWVMHSGAYDLQVVERFLHVRLEELQGRVLDTIIMSKLIDPARFQGHGLKLLSQQYVDPTAPDTAAGLYAEFRKYGGTKATGWSLIPVDNELYTLYAGLDVILTRRLFDALAPMVREKGVEQLFSFERDTQGYLNILRRRGLRVDLAYAEEARDHYLRESEMWLARINELGLDNPNSPKQVVAALLASGADLSEYTPSGALKASKQILLPLAGFDEYWNPVEGAAVNPLARAIMMGRKADRWANAYLGKFLDLADASGRIHPNMTGLEARTSRMAVSEPPLQQLPSSDWSVRRAILAEPGERIISADYAQIELRVVAALANIKGMKQALAEGRDLHDFTAELAYGPDFTKENRKHMKGAGFGIVYGGGAKGLAPKLGLDVNTAKRVVATYNRVYPEIARYSKRLQREAYANGMVMRSQTGRILSLDRDRTYAAINYQVQSLAADILKEALGDLFAEGLGDYIRMPVHDEIIASAPADVADDVARKIGEVMSRPLGRTGIHLDAEGEVTGDHWGAAYTPKAHPEWTSASAVGAAQLPNTLDLMA